MSEETWYVRHDNQVLGPFTKAELTQRLKRRQLTWLALAIRPGDREWRLLEQIPGLSQSMGIDQEVKAFGEAWIFLRVDKNKKSRRWFGPWTTEAAEARLKSGELSFDDLAWRAGMKDWVRLGGLEEFGAEPNAPSAEEPMVRAPAASEIPAEELWQSIVHAGELRRLRHELPPEAHGEDLVGSPDWMKILMMSLAAVCLLGSVPSRARAAGPGGHLEIMPLKLASEQPSLVLQTDAAVEQPIQVTITGKSGEILQLPSYYRTLRIKRQAGEVPTVNLAELKLPQGRYGVEVIAGEAQASASIFLGVEDAAFKQALALHQKAIAGEQQLEKKTLFYISRELEALALKLSSRAARRANQSQWKDFYARWRQDFSGARAPLDRLLKEVHAGQQAFPEKLEALKKAADQLRHVAADLDTAISRSRDPASVKALITQETSPGILAAEFRKIIREAASLSASSSGKTSDSEVQLKNRAE